VTGADIVARSSAPAKPAAHGWAEPSPLILALGLGGMALASLLLVLLDTRWGIGLTDDSYWYVTAARGFLAGQGFTLSSHWAPLLPAVLILLGGLKIDLLAGTRVLNALLFSGSIVLAGLTVQRAARSGWFGLLGAALVLVSADLVDVHSWLMTEALFHFTTLLALYLLVRYFDQPKLGWLIAAGLAADLVALARLNGVMAVFAGVVVVFFRSAPLRKRLRDGAIYALAGGLPIGLYVLFHNLIPSGTISEQGRFTWGPFNPADYAKVLYNILLWFMPGRLAKGHEFLVTGFLVGLLLAFVVVFTITHRRGWWKSAWDETGLLAMGGLTLLALLHLLFLYYSWGYNIESDMRKLTPAHLALLLALLVALAGFWKAGGRVARLGLAAVVLVFAGFNLVRTAQTVQTYYAQGLGYNNRYWAVSETSAFLLQHPDVQIVSSAPYGLYFKIGRPTHHVLEYSTPASLDQFLRETHGYLVIFAGMPMEIYNMDEATYTQGLVKVKSFDDATFFQIQP
jgi:hypothetical protein